MIERKILQLDTEIRNRIDQAKRELEILERIKESVLKIGQHEKTVNLDEVRLIELLDTGGMSVNISEVMMIKRLAEDK